jgi:ribonucleoside-diphosphate reductase alpha chain
MVTTDDVKIHEHLRIQEVCQQWVDASISKTINLPASIGFEDFRDVYTTAYESECKGCTTYRPTDARGAVLTRIGPDGRVTEVKDTNGDGASRGEVLTGKTVQLKWQALKSSIYLCLNTKDGKPYEVFLMSKDQRHMEWTTTVTLLLSRLMRMGVSVSSLAHELRQIASTEGGWAEGVFYPSLVAYIGEKLELLAKQVDGEIRFLVEPTGPLATAKPLTRPVMSCEECGSYNVAKEEGCLKCRVCGWTRCG